MIELRPGRAEDLDEVCALFNRAYAHDGEPYVMTVEELVEELSVPYFSYDEDSRAAVVDGELVGWSVVAHAPADSRLERAYLIGTVDAAHRGKGVGRALLGWSLERATERLRARANDLPKSVRVDADEQVEANHRLYRRFGFEPARWFEQLGRPLTDLPDGPDPAGVSIEAWPDTDEETHRVQNESFADHWGTPPTSLGDWARRVRGHNGRPELSFVAMADGEMVGICQNAVYPEDEAVAGRKEAWLATIGTVRAWRGKGVASALIRRSLRAFADAALDHALLGVDADSPSGAQRLYRNLGFQPERLSITYEIEIT